jgi:hypothetical protein
MDVEEGGRIRLGIVAVKREAVILGDLPPQGVSAGREIGLLSHARYVRWIGSRTSSPPRRRQTAGDRRKSPRRFQCPCSLNANRVGSV